MIESIPKAEVRSIDLWSINVSTPRAELVRKDSLPAALGVSEAKPPESGTFSQLSVFSLDFLEAHSLTARLFGTADHRTLLVQHMYASQWNVPF